MAKNIELEQLVINKLTQEQFDSIEEKNPAELYFITDAEVDGGKGAQVEEMPEATEMNAGQIVQYVGETIPDVEATVVITQTVGDSLTDLKVDMEKFKKASGLTEAGSLEFVAEVQQGEVANVVFTEGENAPGSYIETTTEDFVNFLSQIYGVDINSYPTGYFLVWHPEGSAENIWSLCDIYGNLLGEAMQYETIEASGLNVHMYYTALSVPCVYYSYTAASGDVTLWNVDAKSVDVSDYGISYSGAPSNGDTLKVDYTPFVGGYEKGYFYVNQAQLSEPIVTIEQTVGTSLSNLSIDVDKFIEAEQPVGDCSVEFVVSENNPSTVVFVGESGCEISATPQAIYDLYLYRLASDLDTQDIRNNLLFIYVDENQIQVGYDNTIYYDTTVTELAEFGITFIGTPVSGEHITGVYTPKITVWLKNGQTAKLSDYNISYAGEPIVGDVLTINYIASSVVAHNWNQINVQPASKSSSGIEWVTKVDLPGDYVGNEYYAAPYYIIEGGLPDGTYEFYFSTKTTSESQLPLGEVIFKVLLTIDNENMQAFGKMGYVFDGNYMNDGNNMFSPDSVNIWGFIKKNNSDIVLYSTDRPLSTSVLAYNGHQEVLGCFKLSKIENINTGEVYVATGYINIDGTTPKHESEYGGYIKLEGISAQPAIPQHHITYTGDFNSDTQYFTLHQSSAIACGRSACCSELDVSCSSSNGGKYHVIIENKTNSYVVYLKEASGDLENAQIGWNQYYSPYLFLNTKDEESGKITISVGAKGNDNGSSVHCYADTPYSFTPAVITRVGGEINEANHGMILQCQKDSTEEYTQGYFYKATGERVLSPASIDIIWQNPENVTIEIDADKLVTTLNSDFGWDIAWLQEMLQGQHNYIYYNYETPHINCSFYGDIYEESIVSCFKISNLDTLENGYVEFSTQNYQPEHIEIVNGKWEQINVQPESEGGLTKEEADQTYLPLSGGTLTGALGFSAGTHTYSIVPKTFDELTILIDGIGRYAISSLAFYHNQSNQATLGFPGKRWKNVYTTTLNNGADLAIPIEGGTLARVEDIDAAVGDISTALTAILGE